MALNGNPEVVIGSSSSDSDSSDDDVPVPVQLPAPVPPRQFPIAINQHVQIGRGPGGYYVVRQAPVPQAQPDRKVIHLVKNLNRTVPVADHLGSLPNADNARQLGGGLGFGTRPVHVIQFLELQLSQVEEMFKRNPVEFRPLRNYLLGKQKGSQKLDSAISVFADIRDSTNQISYGLQVNDNLLSKIFKLYPHACFTVELKIAGFEQGSGRPQPYQTGGGLSTQTFGTTDQGGAKLSDILSRQDKIFRLSACFGPNGRRVPITRDYLTRIRTQSLTFSWTIGMSLANPRLMTEPFSINSNAVLQNIYGLEDSTKDLVIVAANGAEIKCHKNILMAQSNAFHTMLVQDRGMLEAQNGRLELIENSEEGIRQFIRCLYGFPIPSVDALPCDMALELFQLSNKYGISGVENYLKDLMTLKGMEWFSVDAILELYFIVRNVQSLEELKNHVLIEIATLTEEQLTESEYFQKLSKNDSVALIFNSFKWK